MSLPEIIRFRHSFHFAWRVTAYNFAAGILYKALCSAVNLVFRWERGCNMITLNHQWRSLIYGGCGKHWWHV